MSDATENTTGIRLSAPEERPRRRWRFTREKKMAWLFVLPASLLVFVLVLGPIVRAGWMSFHTIDLKRPDIGQPFVGLENYINVLQDPYFWYSIERTMYFMVVSIAIEMVPGRQCRFVAESALLGSRCVAGARPHSVGVADHD